jgi:murein DD-endopeptidase MepM/ murein hydrolase activator NlpD
MVLPMGLVAALALAGVLTGSVVGGGAVGSTPTVRQNAQHLRLASTAPRSGSPGVWPVTGSVIRGFDPPAQPWLAGHRGVDIAAVVGATVVAAQGGLVKFTGEAGGVGVVVVEFAPGLHSTYQPLLPQVHESDTVIAGDVLGTLTASTHCPQACLHLGVKVVRLDGDGTGSEVSYLEPLAALGLRPVLLPLGDEPRRSVYAAVLAASMPQFHYACARATSSALGSSTERRVTL